MLTRSGAARRLNEINTELIGLHEELAELVNNERASQVETWEVAIAQKAPQWLADKAAAVNTYATITTHIIKKRGRIEALVEERDFLRFCIKYSLLEG